MFKKPFNEILTKSPITHVRFSDSDDYFFFESSENRIQKLNENIPQNSFDNTDQNSSENNLRIEKNIDTMLYEGNLRIAKELNF